MLSRFWALSVGALLLLTTTSLTPAAAIEGEPMGRLNIDGAQAAHHISQSYGGSITEFIAEYAKLRDGNSKVVLDDFCISACTLTLALLKPGQVCAAPTALFGFHSATIQPMAMMPPVFAKEATRLIWNLYPENVREALRARGWDGDGDQEHPDLIYIRATEFVPACGE